MGKRVRESGQGKDAKQGARAASGRPPEPLLFLWSVITVLYLGMKNTFRAGDGEEPDSSEKLIYHQADGLVINHWGEFEPQGMMSLRLNNGIFISGNSEKEMLF